MTATVSTLEQSSKTKKDNDYINNIDINMTH